MNTTIDRIDAYGEFFEIEVQVSGTLNPYWPGNYDNPPEGGDVEDVAAVFWDEAAKKNRNIPLTKEEEARITAELAEQEVGEEYEEY